MFLVIFAYFNHKVDERGNCPTNTLNSSLLRMYTAFSAGSDLAVWRRRTSRVNAYCVHRWCRALLFPRRRLTSHTCHDFWKVPCTDHHRQTSRRAGQAISQVTIAPADRFKRNSHVAQRTNPMLTSTNTFWSRRLILQSTTAPGSCTNGVMLEQVTDGRDP